MKRCMADWNVRGAGLAGLALAVMLAGCAPATAPAADQSAAAIEAVKKVDEEWVKAGTAKQVDAWLSFYSDDVAVLAPNEKATTGKAAARKAIESLLGLPGLKIKWENSNGVASASGDLAVLYGRYEMSFEDGKKTVSDSGNTLEVWKKQADGSWKCVIDTWNSDVPLAPPAK